MANPNEIEWPSFDSVMRELSPEHHEARLERQAARNEALPHEEPEIAELVSSHEEPEIAELASSHVAADVEPFAAPDEAPLREIPDSTVDDIAAVVMNEILGSITEEQAQAFVGDEPLSDEMIDQLLSNEEFVGHLVDLDSPSLEYLSVPPEQAWQTNFIQPSPAEFPADPTIDLVDFESIDHPHPQTPPATPLATEVAQTPYIDLVRPQDFTPAPATPLPTADEDPWQHIRPADDDDDTKNKKIVFWADRPKFFGGEARHQARAARQRNNELNSTDD